jgi:DNA-binding YbaB/EbfC family protein
MARRGGYMGGMPGNMNNLMKQAQRMQRQLEENKKKLEETDFTVTSGGGAVRLTVGGARIVKDLQIDPEAVDPDDVEMLQDMLVIAFNDAMKQIDEASEKLTGGMGMGL